MLPPMPLRRLCFSHRSNPPIQRICQEPSLESRQMRCLFLFLSSFCVTAFQVVSKRCTSSSTLRAVQQQEEKQKSLSAQNIAASLAPAFFALMVTITPAQAIDNSVFNHDYADPLHPLCNRKIEVAKDGKTFHYSGTAVGPKDGGILRGCSRQEIEEYGIRQESFDGHISENNRISIGDGILEGVWEPQNTADTNLGYEDVDGIRWKDGNKWVVNSQVQATKNQDGTYIIRKKPLQVVVGEFIFLAYIGVSTLAGFKGVLNVMEKKKQQEA